jgi:hypothetical protein
MKKDQGAGGGMGPPPVDGALGGWDASFEAEGGAGGIFPFPADPLLVADGGAGGDWPLPAVPLLVAVMTFGCVFVLFPFACKPSSAHPQSRRSTARPAMTRMMLFPFKIPPPNSHLIQTNNKKLPATGSSFGIYPIVRLQPEASDDCTQYPVPGTSEESDAWS